MLIYTNAQYNELFLRLMTIARDHRVNLSEYAVGLVALSIEGWLEDFPSERFASRAEPDKEALAIQIFEDALRDPHVTRSEVVVFADLLYSLANSAKKLLDDLINKGF